MCSQPCVHLLLPSLKELLKDLLSKFLKLSVIVDCTNLTKIKYKSTENQKSEPFIGSETKKFISEHGKKKFDLKKFQKDVPAFYVSVVDCMLAKLPFSNKLLEHIQVADLTKKQQAALIALNSL